MKTRPSGFILHFGVPREASSRRDLVIHAADQPYPSVGPEILVGLHGAGAEQNVLSDRTASGAEGLGRLVRILVRPGVDPIVSRRRGDGLRGLRCFDALNANRDVKLMMGEMWRYLAGASATRDGTEAATDVHWDRPASYMCKFPNVVSEIFAMLPDLDVMVAFTRCGPSLRRVAIVPIAKLATLAEWGEADGSDNTIVVRTQVEAHEIEVPLPKRTYTLPGALHSILGINGHERGDHPLRNKTDLVPSE